MKSIFFEPLGYIDQSMLELFDHPPEGYEFVIHRQGLRDRVVTNDTFINRAYPVIERLLRWGGIPDRLLKAYVDSHLRRPPPGTALTYAYNHLVFRPEPWICQVEFPTNLIGRDIRILRRWKHVIERAFASPWCRKIIAWGEEGKQALLRSLDSSAFTHKIEIVPLVVRKREFIKSYEEDGRIKLLFVGSGNRSGDFYLKGVKETLEAFRRLSSKYDNLTFVIRSDMPREWKQRSDVLPNFRVIDHRIPWADLEKEYKTADIFVHAALFPGNHVAPLDAMSFEVPVVAVDYGDCREKIQDGVTGLLVPKSPDIPDIGENGLPARHTHLRPLVERAYRTLHKDVVQGIVEKCSILIENPQLRRRMGAAGRHQVENGYLSIEARNQNLKRIFDEATAHPNDGT